MFEWMAWTLPVAIFFTCIVLMLIGMTVWEIKSPTTARRGFLPLETTRGDRLFIGLLGADYINLIFVGLSGKLGAALGLQADPLDIKIGKDIQFSNKALKRYQELGRPGYLLETSRLDPGYYLSTVADLN